MTRWPAVHGGVAWRRLVKCGGLMRAMQAEYGALLGE